MNPLEHIVSLFDSQTDFADKLTALLKERGLSRVVSQQNVSYWVQNPTTFPAECCIPAEELSGGVVTRYQLLPNVFGSAEQAAASQSSEEHTS